MMLTDVSTKDYIKFLKKTEYILVTNKIFHHFSSMSTITAFTQAKFIEWHDENLRSKISNVNWPANF